MGVFQIVTGCLIIKYIKWFAYGAAKRIDGLLLVQLSASSGYIFLAQKKPTGFATSVGSLGPSLTGLLKAYQLRVIF